MDHSPYRLPDGPVAIQFSGGRTSAYMLWHILEAQDGALPPDVHVLFQNTGREMPETLDFVAECGRRWGVPITWIEYRAESPGFDVVGHNSASRAGEPFAALVRRRRYLPNPVARFCTTELKVRPAKRWMLAQGYRHWASVVGIRADEAQRCRPQEKQHWRPVWPLAAAGVAKQDVAAFWAAQPFDLRLSAVNGKTPLGNCDGCFLKSEAARAALGRDFPERAAWWAAREAETGTTFRQGRPWADLIDFAARQPDWLADGGAALFCGAEDGECFA